MSTSSTLFIKRSTLVVHSLPFDPLLVPRRPAPLAPKRSRFFPPINPTLAVTLAVERSMSAAEKAEVWSMAVERALLGLRWTLRKNPKRLHINSIIIEGKANDGSIVIERCT